MSETQSESYARSTLETLGFEVDRIPTENRKTADLLVTDQEGGPRYLIEVKERLDDAKELAERNRLLSRGGVWSRSTPTVYCDVVSKRVKEASKQLGSTDVDADFRLVWLDALGLDPELQYRRSLATLYGVRPMLDLEDPSFAPKCLHFDHSEFFRQRDVLDGAILSYGDYFTLALNEFSPRLDALRGAPLAVAFGEAVFDPTSLADTDGFITAIDVEVSRKNEADVLRAVQAKYGRRKLTVMRPSCYMAEAVVQRD